MCRNVFKNALTKSILFIGVIQIEALRQKKPHRTGKPFATVLLVSFEDFKLQLTQLTGIPPDIIIDIVIVPKAYRGCPCPLSRCRRSGIRLPRRRRWRALTFPPWLRSRTHLRVYYRSPWSCKSMITAVKNRWCLHPCHTSVTGDLR